MAVPNSSVELFVWNGGRRSFAVCIKLSYCSADAVKVVPGVVVSLALAASQAALKVCLAQFSFGRPTLLAAGKSGFSRLRVICCVGSVSGSLMMWPNTEIDLLLIVLDKVSS